MRDIETFIDDVADMRAKQDLYFKERNPVILKEAKCLEAHIDRAIKIHREEAAGQTNLLDQIEEGSK